MLVKKTLNLKQAVSLKDEGVFFLLVAKALEITYKLRVYPRAIADQEDVCGIVTNVWFVCPVGRKSKAGKNKS